jgi:hypothetical protein
MMVKSTLRTRLVVQSAQKLHGDVCDQTTAQTKPLRNHPRKFGPNAGARIATTTEVIMAETTRMLEDLRLLLRDVLGLRQAGATHQKLARAQGHLDGYMKCLLDHKLTTQGELLAMVADERRRSAGPATGEAAASYLGAA